MAKALAYGRKRWNALTRYLDEGAAEIDNNAAERAMRAIAIGRKNWLFAGSVAGGERAAAIYSVIETAKLNGVEPQAYIANIIEKFASGWPTHAGTNSCRGTGQVQPHPQAWRRNYRGGPATLTRQG